MLVIYYSPRIYKSSSINQLWRPKGRSGTTSKTKEIVSNNLLTNIDIFLNKFEYINKILKRIMVKLY